MLDIFETKILVESPIGTTSDTTNIMAQTKIRSQQHPVSQRFHEEIDKNCQPKSIRTDLGTTYL